MISVPAWSMQTPRAARDRAGDGLSFARLCAEAQGDGANGRAAAWRAPQSCNPAACCLPDRIAEAFLKRDLAPKKLANHIAYDQAQPPLEARGAARGDGAVHGAARSARTRPRCSRPCLRRRERAQPFRRSRRRSVNALAEGYQSRAQQAGDPLLVGAGGLPDRHQCQRRLRNEHDRHDHSALRRSR